MCGHGFFERAGALFLFGTLAAAGCSEGQPVAPALGDGPPAFSHVIQPPDPGDCPVAMGEDVQRTMYHFYGQLRATDALRSVFPAGLVDQMGGEVQLIMCEQADGAFHLAWAGSVRNPARLAVTSVTLRQASGDFAMEMLGRTQTGDGFFRFVGEGTISASVAAALMMVPDNINLGSDFRVGVSALGFDGDIYSALVSN